MSKSLRFVGLDVHKDSIVIAVAEEGREAANVHSKIPNDWGPSERRSSVWGRTIRCDAATRPGPVDTGSTGR